MNHRSIRLPHTLTNVLPYLRAGVALARDVGPAVLGVPADEAALAVARVQRARAEAQKAQSGE